MGTLHYILDKNKLAVPTCDVLEWGRFFESRERIVAQEDIGSYWVSTVFVGINMSIPISPDVDPLLFESMVFSCGKTDLWCDRCSTWEEAIEMHERAVAQCMTWLSQLPVIME